MTASTIVQPFRGGTKERDAPARVGVGGDWPRTTRVLPWMIALFLVVLWLVPINSTHLPFQLPIDSSIDRVELVALALTWLVAIGASGSYGPRWRSSRLNIAIGIFLLIATASVLLNLTDVVRAEELELAFKKLSLLFCYATFFMVVATSVRQTEMPRFVVLLLGLAAVAAVGTIVEYRTDINYFYEWAAKLPLVSVAGEPPDPLFGRPAIVGPTDHGLAATTILSLVMPFALVGLMSSKHWLHKILYAIVLALILAGSVATLRKTALVVPGVALIVLLLYQPRRMFRLLPLGVVIVIFMQVVSPGALTGIRYQLQGGSKLSNEGRTNDYPAVGPDFKSRPLAGRGYGTYDPKIHFQKQQGTVAHRTLDNMLLVLLLEVGILGLLAYVAIGVTAIAGLHKAARSKDFARAGPAVALISAIFAFLVANALFDTLAFPQVPYLYFFLLGFSVVLASSGGRKPAPARRSARLALVE